MYIIYSYWREWDRVDHVSGKYCNWNSFVFINSRTAAIYAILGALLPIPIAILLGVDSESLNAGLMGYNGVLCAIALGDKSWKGFLWASCVVFVVCHIPNGGNELGYHHLDCAFCPGW